MERKWKYLIMLLLRSSIIRKLLENKNSRLNSFPFHPVMNTKKFLIQNVYLQ